MNLPTKHFFNFDVFWGPGLGPGPVPIHLDGQDMATLVVKFRFDQVAQPVFTLKFFSKKAGGVFVSFFTFSTQAGCSHASFPLCGHHVDAFFPSLCVLALAFWPRWLLACNFPDCQHMFCIESVKLNTGCSDWLCASFLARSVVMSCSSHVPYFSPARCMELRGVFSLASEAALFVTKGQFTSKRKLATPGAFFSCLIRPSHQL